MHRNNRCVFVWVGLAVLALVAGFAGTVFAQQFTATVTGTITDSKGLAMVGVTVVVHNNDTGVDSKPVMTNESGVYVVQELQPGKYDITATQTGFATINQKNVTLEVGQTLRFDVVMPVATQQSVVTVTTEVPVLETEKTSIAQNISENLTTGLPLSTRNFNQLTLLAPGLNPDGSGGGAAFHGINALYSNNTIDGANNNDNYGGGVRGGTGSTNYLYSPDSLREFQVASGGFNADTGQSAGGAVNAVTKSGTNAYHGDVFYNGRSADFNAFDELSVASALAKNPPQTPRKSVLDQDQYGGSIGGRLIKDKLFFFVTVDDFDLNNPSVTTTPQLTPTIDSFLCPAAITPLQCTSAKAFLDQHILGTFAHTQWQGVELIKLDSQVDQADHVSILTNWHDTSTDTPNSGDFAGNNLTSLSQDREIIANWTRIIGTSKVNEFRFLWSVTGAGPLTEINPYTGMPGVALTNLFTYGNSGGGQGIGIETRAEFADNFSWTKGTHTLKFGVDISPLQDNERSASNSGGVYTYSGSVPETGAGNANFACNNPAAATPNTIFCDWLLDLYRVPTGSVNNGTSTATGQHWNNFSQFVDNIYNAFPQSFHYLIPLTDYAGFVQDTWKFRPNITLNYGLRYDLQDINNGAGLPNSIANHLPPPPPAGGCAGVVEPVPDLPCGSFDLPLLDTYTATYPNQYDAIQPRVGVAWNIFKNTVIRAGGGNFFAKTEGHNVKNAFSGAGESTSACAGNSGSGVVCAPVPNLEFPNVFFNQQNGGLLQAFTLPGAATTAIQAPPPFAIPTPTFGIRGVSPNLRRPEVWTFDLGVEQRLRGNFNLSVSYSFARGTHLPGGNDFNIASNIDPSLCASAVASSCGVAVTKQYSVENAAGQVISTQSIPFYWQPASNLVGPINGNSSVVNSTYHGLIVTLRKPMSHQVELLVNYTWSHSTDDGEQGSGNGGNPAEGQLGIPAIDPFNQKAEYGNSGTDLRHRMTASVLWEPTFDKYVDNRVGKELLGGWSLSSSVIAQSGSHFTGQMGGSSAPAVTYCGLASQGTVAKPCTYTGFYNTSGVLLPAPVVLNPLVGSMGGAGIDSPGNNLPGRYAFNAPGTFVLPNLYNIDLRLEKSFVIKERYHFTIRGEAFNLFNSTLVLAENTTQFNYGKNCPGSPTVSPTCLTPGTTFGQPSAVTGGLLGPRQMQASARFEF